MTAWRPERGTRVALAPRAGGPVRWASDEAFRLWHTVNAYDSEPDGGDVVLGLSVGEPVFAPSPGTAPGEGGHWMTYATDRTENGSWLLVIPADDPGSGPVARVRIPVRNRLGLRGNWLPTRE